MRHLKLFAFRNRINYLYFENRIKVYNLNFKSSLLYENRINYLNLNILRPLEFIFTILTAKTIKIINRTGRMRNLHENTSEHS